MTVATLVHYSRGACCPLGPPCLPGELPSASCLACRKQAADDFYNDKLLHQSMSHWRLCAKWGRDSGWKEDMAFDHWSETMLLKAMQSWQMVGIILALVKPDLHASCCCFRLLLRQGLAALGGSHIRTLLL